MPIAGIDHVALPTGDPEACLRFYKSLGCRSLNEDDWRAGRRPTFSMIFGINKINFHPGVVTDLRGPTAVPGCGDVCFVWAGGLPAIIELLDHAGIAIIYGPADRDGGRGDGKMHGVSVYVRDPDQNLIEFICYGEAPVGQI